MKNLSLARSAEFEAARQSYIKELSALRAKYFKIFVYILLGGNNESSTRHDN